MVNIMESSWLEVYFLRRRNTSCFFVGFKTHLLPTAIEGWFNDMKWPFCCPQNATKTSLSEDCWVCMWMMLHMFFIFIFFSEYEYPLTKLLVLCFREPTWKSTSTTWFPPTFLGGASASWRWLSRSYGSCPRRAGFITASTLVNKNWWLYPVVVTLCMARDCKSIRMYQLGTWYWRYLWWFDQIRCCYENDRNGRWMHQNIGYLSKRKSVGPRSPSSSS